MIVTPAWILSTINSLPRRRRFALVNLALAFVVSSIASLKSPLIIWRSLNLGSWSKKHLSRWIWAWHRLGPIKRPLASSTPDALAWLGPLKLCGVMEQIFPQEMWMSQSKGRRGSRAPVIKWRALRWSASCSSGCSLAFISSVPNWILSSSAARSKPCFFKKSAAMASEMGGMKLKFLSSWPQYIFRSCVYIAFRRTTWGTTHLRWDQERASNCSKRFTCEMSYIVTFYQSVNITTMQRWIDAGLPRQETIWTTSTHLQQRPH